MLWLCADAVAVAAVVSMKTCVDDVQYTHAAVRGGTDSMAVVVVAAKVVPEWWRMWLRLRLLLL